MRKFIFRATFLVSILFISPHSNSASTPSAEKTTPIQVVLDKIASLKIKDIQKLTGRKMTFKEKITFWLVKQQIKHKSDKGIVGSLFRKLSEKKTNGKSDSEKGDGATSKGQTAFVFGLVAVGLLILGLFTGYALIGSLVSAILAIVLGSIAKKENPSDNKAGVAKLLGWITLGLIALLFILVAIAFASIFN